MGMIPVRMVARVDLLGHTVNGHADLGLVVEQLPQADRPASTVVGDLPLVDVDRPEARNLEQPRLQNRRAVHDRQVRGRRPWTNSNESSECTSVVT